MFNNFSYDFSSYSTRSSMSTTTLIIYGVIALIGLVAEWRIYTKAGEHGWAVLIPIYNMYVLYRIICGNGLKMFLMLIPIFNIYWAIKSMIMLAHAYGKSTAFGILMIFFSPICQLVLAFGSAEYVGPDM